MVKKSPTSSRRGKQAKEKESEWILSPEANARLDALAAMPDDQIDFSDIPEVFDFSDWKRVPFRPIKHQISFRVDVDVLMFFQIEGKGYQTKMNQVLRDYMRQKRREAYIAEFGEPTEEDKAARTKSSKKVTVRLKPRKKKPQVKVAVPARAKNKKIKRKKSPRK
jgi:uncharacterized protein (DUF4415 family)